ncbi:MAG: methyltransferase domain-containing protein [Deltaproteobacteria bacterium]|nr:MAG: methyltransferase domain-containing protein [Deltaproteobacteria bacterium]
MTESRASQFFDAYARDFSAIYGTRNTLPNRLVNRWFRKSMRLRYEMTLAACEPVRGKAVLDVGCGPGHYAVALAERGARRVLGIDFAPSMIELAGAHARAAGVEKRCEFAVGDFLTVPIEEVFDYSIVMGFMDYIREPARVIDKVLSLTRQGAFFSFPADGGPLAWQRKLRYRNRCDLFLYDETAVERLFESVGNARVDITKIERDFFVAVSTH